MNKSGQVPERNSVDAQGWLRWDRGSHGHPRFLLGIMGAGFGVVLEQVVVGHFRNARLRRALLGPRARLVHDLHLYLAMLELA